MRLQFIFNNKQVKITTILFKNVTPILDIDKIAYFKETQLSGIWLKKEFRYSFDDIVWSNWSTLTQQALINLKFTNQTNFYVEILYTRATYNSAGIEDFYLFYDSNTGTPVDPIIGTIDADTLQGQDGQYYLNRENAFGPYIDLTAINTPLDISLNSAGIYNDALRVDNSAGTTLAFKKIVGVGGVIIRDTSDGIIEIDVSGGGSYVNPSPVTSTVGGITIGDTFFADGKDFADTMEKMFFPTLYPTLVNPSNTFSAGSTTYLQIIGNTIDISFTSTFNRGTINPAYETNGYRSGYPTNYIYSGPFITGNYSSMSLIDNRSISDYVVPFGVVDWSSQVFYDGGDQPMDSEGNPYNSPLPSGHTNSKTDSIEGVFPLFANTVNVSISTQQPLVSMITGNNIVLNLVAETDEYNRQFFEIPDTWLTQRSLIGIQTYNPYATNPWFYQDGSATSSLLYWITDNTIHEIYGNGINYTKYIYNGTERGPITIRLVF